RMSPRQVYQTRLKATRIIRNIIPRYLELDCNHVKMRDLCAVLYSIASEEPKASYKYKMMSLQREEGDSMDDRFKSKTAIIVDSLIDLVVLTLDSAIERIQEEPNDLPFRRAKGGAAHGWKEITQVERLIMTDEELASREIEDLKKEKKLNSVEKKKVNEFESKRVTNQRERRARQKQEAIEDKIRRLEARVVLRDDYGEVDEEGEEMEDEG
ncbi:hypothetical protein PFISCL1PPCAC_8194, partial [Pristionchus fissidentatus]